MNGQERNIEAATVGWRTCVPLDGEGEHPPEPWSSVLLVRRARGVSAQPVPIRFPRYSFTPVSTPSASPVRTPHTQYSIPVPKQGIVFPWRLFYGQASTGILLCPDAAGAVVSRGPRSGCPGICLKNDQYAL